MSIKTDYQLKKLCASTVYDLEYVFVSAEVIADCDKITMVESILNQHHHKRYLITGRHSTSGFEMKLGRKSAIGRLRQENKRLRLVLSKRK